MVKPRKSYDGAFKAQIVLEAIKGEKTLAEITSTYNVQASQVLEWKKEALAELPKVLSRSKSQENQDDKKLIENLNKQLGQLTTEVDWLKKKLDHI